MIETGTVLQDRFQIEKELARGGMGAVYLATDQKFGSHVAIKERCYEGAQLAEAFAREARILNCLHHPILPHVSDYFSEGNGHFLVMEYIEGEDLSEILKREGSFPVGDVVHWMFDLLEGLDYLHSQDPPIIHRDIKPGNLKLTSRGNIVLLDFGLAKETVGGNQGAKSVFGYSRRYSPLEQIEGAGTGPSSDLFSLGATAYHLLTGEAPVDVLARASAIVTGKPDPLRLASDVNRDVDPLIAQVIHRALALDPEQRYGSASEMRTALESAVAASSHAEEHPFESSAPIAAMQTDVKRSDPSESGRTRIPTAVVADAPAVPNKKFRPAPFFYRPAVAVTIVVLALIAIGYAISSVRPAPEIRARILDVENSDVPTAPADTSSNGATNETPSAKPESSIRDTEVASGRKPSVDKPSTKIKTVGEPNEFEEVNGELVPVSSASRRTTSQRTTGQTKRARRAQARQDSTEEPVSSIERIFTGLPADNPPRRQRRYPQD